MENVTITRQDLNIPKKKKFSLLLENIKGFNGEKKNSRSSCCLKYNHNNNDDDDFMKHKSYNNNNKQFLRWDAIYIYIYLLTIYDEYFNLVCKKCY